MTLNNSIVSNNTAGAGGGIYSGNGNGGMLTLNNSTISSNTASINRGGGIFNGDGSTTELINCTVSGNTASIVGGGIYNYGTLTLTNSTISNDLDVNSKNTIIADNSSGNCSVGSPIISDGHNIDSGNTCGFVGTGDLINTDPLLSPLQDNGGSTFTHALLGGSPAIDAGEDTACPVADQRGVARPIDGSGSGSATCDIGAVEAPEYTPTAFCSTVTEIPPLECEALETFYNNTGGLNWTNNTDWLTTNTPCSWYGVWCGGGHVTDLNLTLLSVDFTLSTRIRAQLTHSARGTASLL